jgi:hypothetical protein
MGKNIIDEPRIENLEARLAAYEMREKRDRRNRAVNAGIGAVAPGVAASGFYNYFGDTAAGAGKFVGESVDAVKLARNLMSGSGSSSAVDTYISRIDDGTAQEYLAYRNEGYLTRLEESARLLLDAGGRASENFPGAKSAPVQGLRGAKGKILETTVGWVRGREETETRNTQQYQENYNHMAALRFSAISKLRQLNSKIEDYCGKLSINEAKGHNVTQSNLRVLEGMAKEYNAIKVIAEGSSELSVNDIHEGVKNDDYQALIRAADSYGIRATNYQSWALGGVIVGTALAAYAGSKVAKPMTVVARGAYNVGSFAISKIKGRSKKS